MGKALLVILLSQVCFIPIYLCIYFGRLEEEKDMERRRKEDEEKADLERELALYGAKYRNIIYNAWKALQKAGTGASYLSSAIRHGELDEETALAVIQASRRETMRWADYSVPETAKHWVLVESIFDKCENEIKGVGAD